MRARQLAFWSLVLLLSNAQRGVAEQSDTVRVRIGGVASSLVGLPFELPIEVDLGSRPERLGSFSLRIKWNPTVLKFLGGKDGTFGSITGSLDSVSRGVIRIAGVNPSGVGPRVILGVGEFVPLVAGVDTFRLSVEELYAAGTFADLLPAAAWSDRAYCPALGRFGDVDGERGVNSRDALLVLTHAIGLSIPGNPALGDVDGDGVTGARDALIILSGTVGIDVTQFRVLAIAPGACAAPQRPRLALVPESVTFDLGQSARYVAVARDSTGASMVVTDVVWSSSDDRVVTVSPSGVVSAVGLGTATVRAARIGGGSAAASVRVVNRTTHWVSAFASPEPSNQLGAPELPFGTIQRALEYARPGDTVRVGLGRYEGPLVIARRLVVIGDTGTGGARPRIEAGGSGEGAGIELMTESSVVLYNLAIEGFEAGIEAGMLDTLEVEGLRIRLAQGSCGRAGITVGQARAVVVRRSRLVGGGQWSGCADGISVNQTAGLLLVEDVVITDFGWDGIAASLSDSVVVRRSTIADNYHVGISLGGYDLGTGSPASAAGATTVPTSVAWVVEQSKLLRNYYGGIRAERVRSGYLARSLIDMADYDDAIEVSGNAGNGYLTLMADSVVGTAGYDWISAWGLDSVVVENTRVSRTSGGSFYNVGLVRVGRSSILDIDYGTGIYVSHGYGGSGGRLVVDSVQLRGSSECPRCADGIRAYLTGAYVNRLLGEDLYDAIYVSDSSATITNSAFRNVWQGVYASSYVSPRPRLVVKKSDFLRANYGVRSYNMVTVVDSSALTGSASEYTGIETWGGGADTVRYNTVTGYRYGIAVDDSVAYVGNNTALQPGEAAFSTWRYIAAPADTSIFLNNTVVCDVRGATDAGGFSLYRTTHKIEGNTVTGCNSGVWVTSGDNVNVSLVRNNAITVPDVAQGPGILVSGYRTEVVGNSVTGGSPYAGGNVYVFGSGSSRAPFARIDSNIVRGARVWGIRSEYVDSLMVRGNLVEDVTASCCGANPGGIAIRNIRYRILVERNTLRRVNGAGITIAQGDTATVVVDGNAVSAADTAAVRLTAGKLLMRGNNIRNNRRYGVQITSSVGALHQIHGNAFQGNALYAVLSPWDSVDATGNWWGVDGALPGTAGADSVSGRVNGTSPLAAEPAGLLPLAPPMVAAAPQGTAVRLPAIAVPASRSELERERPVRVSRPARAPKVVKALPFDRANDPRAARLVRAIEWEKQREAQRASIDSSLAALEAARRAAEERRQEVKARREQEWRK